MNQNKFTAGESHILVKIIGVVLFLAGLPLLLGGVYLLILGGSWYYCIAGAGIVVSAWLLWRGQFSGVFVYLAVFAFTLIWTIYESGFVFWPSVPRLVAPIFLGACVLLIAPLLSRNSGRPENTKFFVLGGGVLAVAFVGYLAMMFQPHDVILNSDTKPVAGKASKPTTDAGNDWLAYGRTGEGSRYAPFDQITPENIKDLEIAWSARTGFIADQSKYLQEQSTPLHIDGIVYHCAPAGQISAIDGVTGEIKWQFDPKADSEDWKRCRSLAYFDPGPADACGPRLVQTTVDARLISVRAKDGKICDSFGNGGTVDLTLGMSDVDTRFLVNSSGPVVAGDKIVLGGRVTDNVTVGEPSGVIRAYDALTGKIAWVWDMGQPQLKGLPEAGQNYTAGTPNSWSFLSFDVDLGMVYVPLGNATPDIYGGYRRDFDEEYSSAVVALDLTNGDVVWKFQTVRHDLWDYDLPSQPVLADIPDGEGGSIPGLIQTTKRSQVFVLDRRTGVPIKAVEDRPAPKSDGTIKGERYAATQPYSTEMAAIGTEPLEGSRMWGATPIDHMLCRIMLHSMRHDGEFTTPSTDWSIIFPGPLGGMNFGSAAIDQEKNIMVAVDMRFPLIQRLVPRNDVTPDMKYEGESGPFAPMKGTPYGMERASFLSPVGIPCMQPPWGAVNAIDLASGKHIWQQPAGTSKDLGFGTFQPGVAFAVGLPPLGGPLVTKGIAWFAGTQDYYLRAYNVETGTKLWEARLPTGTQGTPMSYVGKDGRQYIIVTAGGARGNVNDWGDHIVAFALPKS